MKTRALAIILLAVTIGLPALAQTPDPQPTPPPPTPTTSMPPPTAEIVPKPPISHRFFFGGSVGAGFGTVDYLSLSPMIGYHAFKHLDVGLQPFYTWTRDDRYSPHVTTNNYGATLFTRIPVVRGFFLEGDYEYTNYEYPIAPGITTRSTYNAFLAGGGYTFGGRVGFYVSWLYDFSYDGSDPNRPYDSPYRVQAGVVVGF